MNGVSVPRYAPIILFSLSVLSCAPDRMKGRIQGAASNDRKTAGIFVPSLAGWTNPILSGTGMGFIAGSGPVSQGSVPAHGPVSRRTAPAAGKMEAETVTDIDGNVYRVVNIGGQLWMAENLRTTRYRNGDQISNVPDNNKWSNLATGAFCNYSNNPGYVSAYGRLYNWFAVNDPRNIAPEGWHVPSDAEWKALEKALGMSQIEADAKGWRGTVVGGRLKESGSIHWQDPNTGATNTSLFGGLPAGCRSSSGFFDYIGYNAGFWTSTECSRHCAWYRYLYYYNAGIDRREFSKQNGFSVRCVKDE